MIRLDEKLREYDATEPVSFHMPGHKGKDLGLGGMERYDITEIEGFDELYEATGILRDLQEELAELYHSRRSYLLTNGSTGGNLAAICAACHPGETIIVDRACHRSVYHAIEIRGLTAAYAESQPLHAIEKSVIETAITAHPSAKAVVITSPTYEGMIADVEGIAEICHAHGMILLVDAAHGAHFLTGTDWEAHAHSLQCADLVVMSLHKTLPALGQTACIHSFSDRVPDAQVRHYIEIFHTSSPSYLMMAAASKLIGALADLEYRRRVFETYRERLDRFDQKMSALTHIRLWREAAHAEQLHDRGKLLLMTEGGPGSGMALLQQLADRGIALEMAGAEYALAMTSIADEEEDFERLYAALADIDAHYETLGLSSCDDADRYKMPRVGDAAENMISIYPPGTPIVCRGDRIEERHVTAIRQALASGLYVRGLERNE